ncbi:hypothetical protein KIH41_13400 [Litoribacter ruber]|nr:hypothetical protein [Litoribacter ruber]MBT0812276.1 hypothetical protein [Litoribacter ruber]
MKEKAKSKTGIIASIVVILLIAFVVAYNGGYMIGKLRAHIENNAQKD